MYICALSFLVEAMYMLLIIAEFINAISFLYIAIRLIYLYRATCSELIFISISFIFITLS